MSLFGFKKCAACLTVAATVLAVAPAWADEHGSSLSDEHKPLIDPSKLPTRTPPIIEIGPKFLGRGNLDPGFTLPTGAVWQPALWVFGSSRTAAQYFDNGPGKENQEAVTRLDLNFNLRLSPTERIVYSVSPLRKGSNFTGFTRKPKSSDGFTSDVNWDTTALFFEGDFGEIFPNLDPNDNKGLDIGFSVGRQPLFFQEGIMINDTLDSVGLTRDTIVIPGLSPDMRATALFAWNGVNRDDTKQSGDGRLVGLFTETDTRFSTIQLDMAYVFGDRVRNGQGGKGFYWGVGATQRLGKVATSVHLDQSYALDQETTSVSDGTLLFVETSITPPHSDDVVYVNGFWGIDNYAQAARDPTAGGAIARTGVLFSSLSLGNYGAPISNSGKQSAGGAVGYQMFFNTYRTQLIFEAGGRFDTSGNDKSTIGAAVRFQQAFGDRYLWQSDAFLTHNTNAGDGNGAGARTEFLVRF